MFAARVVGLGLDNLVEEFDFVNSGFGVVGGRADDFQSDVLSRGVVPGQPDGGKVTPSELAHDCVFAVLELFANLDGVVAALAVVLGIFLVGRVLGGVVARRSRSRRVLHGSRQLVGSATEKKKVSFLVEAIETCAGRDSAARKKASSEL